MSDTDKEMKKLASSTEPTKEQIALTATYNILVTNELMLAQIYEAISHIKETDKYKQSIKKETKKLEQLVRKFEKKIREVVGPRIGFLADVAQIVQDECQVNIDQLVTAITEEFTKISHPYPLMMAHIELARTFGELAVINLDLRLEEMYKHKIKEAQNLRWMSQKNIFKSTTRLSEMLFEGGNVNLNKNLMCKTALRMIELKLTDVKLLAKSISESDKLNPATDLNES